MREGRILIREGGQTVNSQLIIHEMTHVMEKSLPGDLRTALRKQFNNFEDAARQIQPKLVSETGDIARARFAQEAYLEMSARPITSYALTAQKEYVAETVSHYLMGGTWRETLKELDRVAFDAIEKWGLVIQ